LPTCEYKHGIDFPSTIRFECNEPSVTNSIFCIFHDKDNYAEHEEKVTKRFRERVLESISQNKPLECVGYYLPYIHFAEWIKEKTFAQAVYFNKATFYQGANFNRFEFSREADFSGVQFKEQRLASFFNARFDGIASFYGAQFKEQQLARQEGKREGSDERPQVMLQPIS
jgi:rare lipoprotein A (peptidoglycan hydrolase)